MTGFFLLHCLQLLVLHFILNIMNSVDLFHHIYWQPFAHVGYTHPLLTVQLDLLFSTWLVLGILLAFALVGNYALKRPSGLLYTAYVTLARGFMALIEQSWAGKCPERYFLVITSFFLFIVTCNWCMLLGIEEPTSNYNTTLALALAAFFYIQKETIRHHGVIAYLHDYFKTPFSISRFSWLKLPVIVLQVAANSIAAVALFPLELLSKLSSVISMSFRLFGNIIAGTIVITLWNTFTRGSLVKQILGIVSPVHIIILLFFGVFEGLIQSFVFTILTTTYLSLATHEDETVSEESV